MNKEILDHGLVPPLIMAAHSDICMSVRCRWMTTLDVENRYHILTPLERRVF